MGCAFHFSHSQYLELYCPLHHGIRVSSSFGYGGIIVSCRENGYLAFDSNTRSKVYKQFPNHSDTYSMVPFIYGEASIFTSNLDVLRQLVGSGHKTDFVKTTVSLG
jgi:hypothetical protein